MIELSVTSRNAKLWWLSASISVGLLCSQSTSKS